MGVKRLRYTAPGWGVGELWLEGEQVVWHDPPVVGSAGVSEPEHPLVERLRAYFAGGEVGFDEVALDLDALTDLQREMAAALRAVPRGQTVSYGELAALAGRPRAPRAAGAFCAGNRHSIFVPCHRVVASDGPGSYGDLGLAYKLRLLELEGWKS